MSIVDWRDEGHERRGNEPPDTSSSSSRVILTYFADSLGAILFLCSPSQSEVIIKFYYIPYISECVLEFGERIINIGIFTAFNTASGVE